MAPRDRKNRALLAAAALLLTLASTPALAAEGVVEGVKEGAIEVGKGAKEIGIAVGEAVKETGKEAGKALQEAGKALQEKGKEIRDEVQGKK
jgi:NAD+--asparagine ADP-ribosyltransferase